MENRFHRVAGVLLVTLYGVMWVFIAWQPQVLPTSALNLTPKVPMPAPASVDCAGAAVASKTREPLRAQRNLFEFGPAPQKALIVALNGNGPSRSVPPVESDSQGGAPLQENPGDAKDTVRFLGTLRMNGEAYAVLWYQGQAQVVRVGQTFGPGLTVRRIERHRVELEDARGARFWIGSWK